MNVIAVSLVVIFAASRVNSMSDKFPKDFMFGASTAAYQIEGAWNEDGKGENIWDRLVHTRPRLISDSTSGDVACDSYHKYKEDVALAKNLNLKFYRFSISWARIAPSGETSSLNPQGIAFYNRLIDELIANDIIPLVTMYHWDLPQYLQDLGGWVNPIMSDYFVEYARVLFTSFGDRRGWFSHPIYKGDYPPIMRQWVDRKCKKEGRPWSTLPTFSKDEIKMIKGSADFYALNHYSSRLVTYGDDPNPNYNPDAEYATSMDKSWPISPVASWLVVVPDGLRQLLKWLKNEYGNQPFLITENGYGDGGQLNDTERIDYLTGYLNATLRAIHEDQCNVIGYTVWSLMDNFEWMSGYEGHFGLVKIDFNDPQRPRTPKASYTFFKSVVSTNQLK